MTRLSLKNLATLLSLLVCLDAQLLGIDMGTSFTKVAMVQPGAGLSFVIVEDTKSERKIDTAISFYEGRRYYQTQAVAKRSRSTETTFVYTKVFIDLLESPDQSTLVKKQYFLNHLTNDMDGMVRFVLQKGFKNKLQITIEQVFGMIFKHIKHLAQKVVAKGNKVKDCVVTVPLHWSVRQRLIVQNALRIADLNPLYIVPENTAAAVHYGVSKDLNTTHYVMFYNLGSNYLEISLVEFRKSNATKKSPGEIHILAGYGQNNVGGLQFDLLIKNRLERIYVEKFSRQLSQKGQVRLLSQAVRIKQTLSANKEVHVSIEELDGVDFRAIVNRNDFQRDAEQLLQKLISPISDLLSSASLKPEDIKYVELIGGSIRIPKLQEMIAEAMKPAQVGTHINGDQSMALGCAFLAANSSKKYKVKGLQLYEGWNFDLVANIKNADGGFEEGDEGFINKTVTVFKAGQRFGLVKDFLLKAKQNLEIDFWTEKGESRQLVKTIRLTNISDFKKTYPTSSPKVVLSLKSNSVSVIDLIEAKLSIVRQEELVYLEKIKKEQDNSKRKKKSNNGQSNNSKVGSNSTSNSTEVPEDQYETVQRTKTIQKTHYLKLQVSQQSRLRPLLEGKQLEEMQKVLLDFEKQEWERNKLSQAKNKLQSAIYQGRDLIENSNFKEFATDRELQTIRVNAETNEEKIYEDLDLQTFRNLYREFYKDIEQIKTRRSQSQEREKVNSNIMKDIESFKKKFVKLQQQMEWLTEEQKQVFTQETESVEAQLSRSYAYLKSLPRTTTPQILNKQLLKLVDKVGEQYRKLSLIPKPKKLKAAKKGVEDYMDQL